MTRRRRAELRRVVEKLSLTDDKLAAARRELRQIERQFPERSEAEIAAMTDEQLDELLSLHAAEDGPYARMDELRELLLTPQERRERAAHEQWVQGLSREELDAYLSGQLEPPGIGHRD